MKAEFTLTNAHGRAAHVRIAEGVYHALLAERDGATATWSQATFRRSRAQRAAESADE